VTTGQEAVQLGLTTLVLHASLPVKAILVLLFIASTAVWIIGVMKLLQVRRQREKFLAFEAKIQAERPASRLFSLVQHMEDSVGARVLRMMLARAGEMDTSRLRAAANRAVVAERKRARSLMPVLASIGSASPFIGLLGTVYGIMDAFVRIGAARSASLPVVAPAIGEALFTTALGLAAAIPAVLFYNLVEKQISDFLAELEASATEWIAVLSMPVPAEQTTESAAASVQRPV
jgi:biopolymer transport protein TolQ